MSKQLLAILKKEIDELAPYGGLDAETKRNKLKEALQFYVLNFVYHHPEYNRWVMYGGSALRIIHGLNRMSVDLDFEVNHEVTKSFLEGLKRELEDHFVRTYGAEAEFLSIKVSGNRGLLMKFEVGQELGFERGSTQVHIKIDLNHFIPPKSVVLDRRPVNRDQLSFMIVTYSMSALMASKLGAIFLRGTRGVGSTFFDEKGRDIYDLLWYMERRIVPDFDYLKAKGVDIGDPRTLFDRLAHKMNAVSEENLKQDLVPLFLDRSYIENWLVNWLSNYFQLVDKYQIQTITTLEGIQIHEHFMTDNFSLTYTYNTEEGRQFRIRYILTEYWVIFSDMQVQTDKDPSLENKIVFSRDGTSSRTMPEEVLKKYAALFSRKNRRYFDKVKNIVFGEGIITKTIRVTTEKLNRKEEIVLNKSALVSCELDDLLK